MKDFLFRFFAWIITLPLLVGSVAFAFFHTQKVDVIWSPFHAPASIPLYIPVLTAIAFGFFFGALMTWAAGGRLRDKARTQKKKIAALEKQLAATNQNTYKSHNYSIVPTRLLERKP